MIDRSEYMTDEEIKLLESDMEKQVLFLKKALSDKSKFKKKSNKSSVMKVGDEEHGDE